MGTLKSLHSLKRGVNMKVVYPVIFTRTDDKKDTYLIDIPDIKGMTEGYGMSDAIEMARDYIGSTLYDKDDDTFPKASDFEQIDLSKGEFTDAGESFISLVDVDITAYRRKMNAKAVRKNVSLPAWLDLEAEAAHLNLSRVLQDALKEKLNLA